MDRQPPRTGRRRAPAGVTVRAVARARAGIAQARALFQEYARSLPVDLSFQAFAAELATLPGAYAAPEGGLWIARVGGRAAGCVAVRPLSPRIAELKRLYVRSRFRGRGLGRLLAERAITFAERQRYRALRLDTIPTMVAAQRLYRELGFRRIRAYRFNPVAGSSYWELRRPRRN